jgi:hypothetical protein
MTACVDCLICRVPFQSRLSSVGINNAWSQHTQHQLDTVACEAIPSGCFLHHKRTCPPSPFSLSACICCTCFLQHSHRPVSGSSTPSLPVPATSPFRCLHPCQVWYMPVMRNGSRSGKPGESPQEAMLDFRKI